MKRYEAILFDFDGVIVDSEPVHYECWCSVLSQYGIAMGWEYYAANFIGVADRRMLEGLVAMASRPVTVDEIYAQYPVKKAMFRRKMEEAVPLSPGVRELLADLSAFRVAVVTSSGRSEVEPVLSSSGLLPRLETVVYGDDVTRHKPDPEPYLLAASRLGVSSALVVEDSDAGEAAGRAAGFDVVRVRSAAEVSERVRQAIW